MHAIMNQDAEPFREQVENFCLLPEKIVLFSHTEINAHLQLTSRKCISS